MISTPPKYSFTYDGAGIYIYHANIGEGLPRHEHSYSHATFCVNGACIIRKEGKEIIINKNTQPVNLIANEWHEIEAVEDETVFINVFATNKY